MSKIDILSKYLRILLEELDRGNIVAMMDNELAALTPAAPKPVKLKVVYDHEKRAWLNIPQELRELWKISCPAVDVEAELAAAAAWMIANPTQAPKVNYSRFLDGWMKRTQQRGGTRGLHRVQQTTDKEAEAWAKQI